jgi:type I restriction enzyme, S subunit
LRPWKQSSALQLIFLVAKVSEFWDRTTWGKVVSLEYGKALREYRSTVGKVPVYGTNGPIGWTESALCQSDGVVIGRKGAYRGVHYSASPFYVIDTAFYLKPLAGVDIDMRWAYYQLLTADINGMDSGSAIPSTSREDFYKLPVAVPPIEDQRRIAQTLRTFDDRIELLRQTNETLEAIAQALFQSWFVDFDPVHAKSEGRRPEGMDDATAALFPDSFEDSPLGPIPAGWRHEPLSQIGHFLNGLAMQKFPVTTETEILPVIKIAQLRKGNTEGADLASNQIKPAYVVKDGDVLFSWSGTLEVEIWTGGIGALNQHLFKVTSESFEKWFYFLWVRRFLPNFRLVAAGKATTMGHIQRSHLDDAMTVVPTPQLLAIADALFTPLIDRVTQNAIASRSLRDARDSLLPRLISGQLQVPDTGPDS